MAYWITYDAVSSHTPIFFSNHSFWFTLLQTHWCSGSSAKQIKLQSIPGPLHLLMDLLFYLQIVAHSLSLSFCSSITSFRMLFLTTPLKTALDSPSYLSPFPDWFFFFTLVTARSYNIIYLFAYLLLASLTRMQAPWGRILITTICPEPRTMYDIDTQKVSGEWRNHSIWNTLSNVSLSWILNWYSGPHFLSLL